MHTRYTLKEVVDFCWKHKRNQDTLYEVLAKHIIWAADNEKLLLVADGEGLCGVGTYSDYPDRVYVHHVVAVRMGLLTLIHDIKERFPGLLIVGLRHHSHQVTFTQNKLWAILNSQQKTRPIQVDSTLPRQALAIL